jgi:hypothetical protein
MTQSHINVPVTPEGEGRSWCLPAEAKTGQGRDCCEGFRNPEACAVSSSGQGYVSLAPS